MGGLPGVDWGWICNADKEDLGEMTFAGRVECLVGDHYTEEG